MYKKYIVRLIAVLGFISFIVLYQSCASVFGLGGYTVSFYANGASGKVPVQQKIKNDSIIILPDGSDLSFGNATFGGWVINGEGGSQTIYEAGSEFTASGNITFIAKWNLDVADFNSAVGFSNKLVWLQNNSESNSRYVLELNVDERIEPQWLYYHGKRNITITLVGVGANRIITYNNPSEDYLFTVSNGVTLILDNNITIQGGSKPSYALVHVTAGGELVMNNGSTITGNRPSGFINTSGMSFGMLGVRVGNSGKFTMNGGTISNNGFNGVYVWNNANFTMNGGTISKNGNFGGGGISVYTDGVFSMNNGNISENIRYGVEVLDRGTFIMNNGVITRNGDSSPGAPQDRGGVWLHQDNNFRRIGGTISGNYPNDIFY